MVSIRLKKGSLCTSVILKYYYSFINILTVYNMFVFVLSLCFSKFVVFFVSCISFFKCLYYFSKFVFPLFYLILFQLK